MKVSPNTPVAPSPYRIALVICYFGVLPNYIRMVFHSASFNPSIDWFIFGDSPPSYPLPPNVSFHSCTLAELEQTMQEACDTPVRIRNPYDVTRFKPAFGLCFEKQLRPYDFWGHVDLDMIYGDLRKFAPDDLLKNYDRLYARGHFSLYRNTTEANRYFMLDAPGAPSYRKVFAARDLRTFDEWDGIWKIYRYHRIRQYHAEVIADILPPTRKCIRRFEATELPNYEHQFFYWHQGKTFQCYYHREGGLFDKEVAYVHFQKRSLPTPDFDPDSVSGFAIGPHGFSPYDRENLTYEEMDLLNPDLRRPISEILRLNISKVTRRLQNFVK